MASTRCMTKVTKRKTRAQRSHYLPMASQSRQVLMKAKTKQSLKTTRLSASAKQAALRQLPKVLKKKLPKISPVEAVAPIKPTTASHGYLLRSRSTLDHSPQDQTNLNVVEEDTDRLKCLSSSHDSGIESAANTSDSEDSSASASESSEVHRVSFPSSLLERPLVDTDGTCSLIRKMAVDLSLATSTPDQIPITKVYVESNCSAATESSFVTLADNILHYGNECIPEFLQDIDDVIKADIILPSVESPFIKDIASTSLEGHSVTEISLCHEHLEDSIDSSTMDVVEQVTRYMYTASAGELEFVMEIFRGAHHSSPLIRTPAILPPKTRSCPTYTLILDLDETLVHCFTNEPPAKFDHSFAVEVPDGNGGETTELAVYARLRPYVKEFLERMAKKFEVVIFTASMKNYSSKMLDLLDPEGVFFKHRFYRDHCVPVGCSFVKDLSIFTRDLSKLIIVDNQIASFAFQIDNGIPIKSWIGDDSDQELLLLAPYLEAIAEQDDLDVRHFLRESLKVPIQLHSHVQTYYPQSMDTQRP